MNNIVTILCMKWGDKYNATYVNKLYNMVKRHVTRPFRFVCFTDDAVGIKNNIEIFPIPTLEENQPLNISTKERGWNKLLTFKAPLYDIKGPVLFLDLDIVIVGNIDEFFTTPGEFFIIKDWLKPTITGNSSVYRFTANQHPEILTNFLKNQPHIYQQHRNEQQYLTAYMQQHNQVNYWNPQSVISFKRHCLHGGIKNWFIEPKIPEHAKIIVFHGKPNPDQAIMGHSGKWFRKIKPAPWITEHWQ